MSKKIQNLRRFLPIFQLISLRMLWGWRGNTLRSFGVKDFWEIFRVMKVRTIRFIMTAEAYFLIDHGERFPQLRMPVPRAMAGFTLNILHVSSRIPGGSKTCAVAGHAGRVWSLIFLNQGLVCLGMDCFKPSLVLYWITGKARMARTQIMDFFSPPP